MAWINTRGTQLSQPPGLVEIDWSNPITRGLSIAASPVLGEMHDFATGQPWTRVNSPTIGATPSGKSLKTVAGSSQYGYFPCDVRTGPMTVLHYGTVDSSALGAIVSLGTTSGTERLVLFYGSTAGNYTASTVPNGGGTESTVSGSMNTVNAAAIVVGSTPATQSIFVNGVRGTSGTAVWSPTGAINRLYVGTRINSTAGAFASQNANAVFVWRRALSADEIASISANPWQLFKPVNRRLYFDVGGGAGGLTIQAPLLTNSSTLYAPTVSAGGSVVQAPLLTNTSDLFSPTLNPGAVQVAPPLLPSENAFFAPVVSAGGSVVQAPLFTNSSTIYGPTVGVGAVAIAPPLFTNSSTIYDPSVAASGPQTIDAPLFTNSSTIYAPSVGEVSPLSDAEMRHMYEMVQAIYAAVVTNAPLDVNLVRVRGQSIIGTGAAADPWGPA